MRLTHDGESSCGRFRIDPVYRGCVNPQEWKALDRATQEHEYAPTKREARQWCEGQPDIVRLPADKLRAYYGV